MDVAMVLIGLAASVLFLASPFLINGYFAEEGRAPVYGFGSAFASLTLMTSAIILALVADAANNQCGLDTNGSATLFGSYSVGSGKDLPRAPGQLDVWGCLSLAFSSYDNIVVGFTVALLLFLFVFVQQIRAFWRKSNFVIALYLTLLMPFLATFYLVVAVFILISIKDQHNLNKRHR